jgi:6-phosphofructokinase 2
MSAIVTFTPNPAIDVSTTVERLMPIRKLRCGPARREPGGGGINVARVVKRLGGEVTAIYPRGGATGQLLSRLVERERIAAVTSETAEETREDFSVHETASGQQFRFVLPGPELAEPEWRVCLDMLRTAVAGARYVVASGSLPPGVPIDFYARACRIAKAANAKFMLDTSGPALSAALAEGVYLVKPNLRELCDVVGDRLDDEAAWVRAGTALVKGRQAEILALTLGDRGALLIDGDHVLRAEPPPLAPVSSVGAGDSFLGALVWGLASEWDIAKAFRLAVAAGSSAVLNPGTELAHADDARRLAASIKVTVLTPVSAPICVTSKGGPQALPAAGAADLTPSEGVKLRVVPSGPLSG